jgi:dCTP deaminase
MSILADHQIRSREIMDPCDDRTVFRGMSYGLSSAGYDVRVDLTNAWNMASMDHDLRTVHTPDGDGIILAPGQSALVGVVEHIHMPVDTTAFVHPKSTWARRGILPAHCVVEPGWKGYLTLLITNHSGEDVTIVDREPIAQIIFHAMSQPPVSSYSGKYQGASRGPQGPRFEKS